MDENFMELLERIRMEYGKGMIVTSGFRAPRYNQTISPKTGGTGPHTTGRAADILVAGPDAYTLIKIAQSLGELIASPEHLVRLECCFFQAV